MSRRSREHEERGPPGTLSRIGERPRIHSYFHDIRAAKEATICHGPVSGDDSGSGEIGHYAAATKAAADRPQLRLSSVPSVISMVICYFSVRDAETLYPSFARLPGVSAVSPPRISAL